MYNHSIFADTFVLSHCNFSSPIIGIIRVSCNISHRILVNLRCIHNCIVPNVTEYGSSPLIVRGLDPGVRYNVIVHVFNDDEVGLNDQMLAKEITVLAKVNAGTVYVH